MNEKERFYYTLQGCIFDLKEYVSVFSDDSLIRKCQECISCLLQFSSQPIEGNNTIQYEGELYRKSHLRAGFDIVQHEDISIPPKQISKIKTNVRFPNGIGNNFALVTLRSSYQNSGLSLPAIGILDSDYTDYLFITIFNSTDGIFRISKEDRFAQLVFIKNNDIELIRSD